MSSAQPRDVSHDLGSHLFLRHSRQAHILPGGEQKMSGALAAANGAFCVVCNNQGETFIAQFGGCVLEQVVGLGGETDLDKVSAMDRPDAWVHRVATNLALSRLRRRRPEKLVTEPPSPQPAPMDDELLNAVRSLSPAQRSVIALRFYLDWSVDDVAEALRKKPGTVRALTHQGMERLRSLLLEGTP